MTTEKPDKPQIHQSMLDMASRCGLQFQRRYGQRFGCWHQEEIVPPGVALATGIAVHAGVEQNLRQKIAEGSLLTLEEVEAATGDAFDGVANNEMRLTDGEAENITQTLGKAKDQSIALVRVHHTELAPELVPLAIEEPFVIELQGYPFDLSGQIDIREDQVIRDTKTRATSPPEDAAKSMQIGMYSLAHKVLHGALPVKATLDCLVKTKVPKVVVREIEPTEEMIKPVLYRIEQFTELVQSVAEGKGRFMPADPENWVCTKRYCGWWSVCRAWSGK